MTDSEPAKTSPKRKAAATKAAPKAAPKPKAAAKAVTPPAQPAATPPATDAQPDEAPIPPRNRHERRSAGKKRPGQVPFKWPPIGPERP